MAIPIVICAIFRNEAPYLREWIEFHRIVGVEHFYLYQNLSEDDWDSVLRPYVNDGVVEIKDWPIMPPSQRPAYQDFINSHRGKSMWAAFIDIDEFLFSPTFPTLPEALQQAPGQWGAVGVNWMCFGASGQEQRMLGPVIERFTLRPADEFGANVHIKSIVRMDCVDSTAGDAHHFNVYGGTFSECGERIPGPFTARPSHRWLRINHYLTKSRQEYLHRISYGRVDIAAWRSPAEFDGYQAADVDDRAIWRFLPSLKSRLDNAAP